MGTTERTREGNGQPDHACTRGQAELREGRAGDPRPCAALGHEQRIVHTGQHYDERMSDVFFVQLGLPEPDVNLGVGSGTQASQTAERAWSGWNASSSTIRPSLAVVYGDVNSTARRRPGRRQARRAARARRGRAAQLRRHHARGDQPAADRPALRPAVRHLAGGDRPPGAGRPARLGHALGRQPDDRHAARQPGQVRLGGRAGGLRPGRPAVRRGHLAPAGQRRRPGAGGRAGAGAARGGDQARRDHPAAPPRPGRRSPRPGCSTTSAFTWWIRSATSSSCRWCAGPPRS